MAAVMKSLRDCRDYATLLCADRIMRKRGANPSNCITIARLIYDHADPAMLPTLDTIKRVVEIDTEIDQPGVVLMRAGLLMHEDKDDG